MIGQAPKETGDHDSSAKQKYKCWWCRFGWWLAPGFLQPRSRVFPTAMMRDLLTGFLNDSDLSTINRQDFQRRLAVLH